MPTQIQALIEVLDAEAACYRKMQTVLSDEAAAISLSRKTNFDRVQAEKESLVVKLQRLETRRKLMVDQLSRQYAVDGHPPVTVRQIARYVDPDDGRALLERADRLRAIIGDVHTQNKRNKRMINQNLQLIKGSLTLLSQLIDGSSVYPKPGARQPLFGLKSGGGRFIRGSV